LLGKKSKRQKIVRKILKFPIIFISGRSRSLLVFLKLIHIAQGIRATTSLTCNSSSLNWDYTMWDNYLYRISKRKRLVHLLFTLCTTMVVSHLPNPYPTHWTPRFGVRMEVRVLSWGSLSISCINVSNAQFFWCF
jgi:hypothetical protein